MLDSVVPRGLSCPPPPFGVSVLSSPLTLVSSSSLFSSHLDAMNKEMLNGKDDDVVPMTKADMREGEKEMKVSLS